MRLLTDISWKLDEPLSKAELSKDDKFVKIPKEVYYKKLSIKNAKIIINIGGFINISSTFKCIPTTKNILKFIEKIANTKFSPDYKKSFLNLKKGQHIAMVYRQTSSFYDVKKRLEIIKKFETGKLTLKDIMGRHVYFEGITKKGSKNVYNVELGS
jgi:hypothetical protein